MTFIVKYHCGERQIGDDQRAESIEDARRLVAAKVADLDCAAEIAIIFRISPSGTEELEESRKLHG